MKAPNLTEDKSVSSLDKLVLCTYNAPAGQVSHKSKTGGSTKMATNNPMKGLSTDAIGDLLAKSRTRNAYGPRLLEFIDSDEAAIDPAEVWPEFANKPASTLYQGFLNAAKKASPSLVGDDGPLMIKQSDDHVYILHRERVAVVMQAQNDTDTDADAE